MAKLLRELLLLSGLIGITDAAWSQSVFIPLGQLPGDAPVKWSAAIDVSADGSVVVGAAHLSAIHREAFRWTLADGMVGIGDLPGGEFHSQAAAVSPNGTIVVGDSVSANSQESFRWTESDGMTTLGTRFANDVTDDGIIVGGFVGPGHPTRAYRYTPAEGITAIGILPGGNLSNAYATTPDGSVIVGFADSTQGGQAFRWTAEDGMVGLGDLPGGEFRSHAFGVSTDGSVVVGVSQVAPVPGSIQEVAFRWTAATGMVSLGDIIGGAGTTQAYDVSADGSIVVGRARSGNRFVATRWDAVNGMEAIERLLANAGVDMTGWQLQHAEAISANGDVIVGSGINPSGQPEAWLASGLIPGTDVPEPSITVFLVIAAAALGKLGRQAPAD